MEHIYRFNRIQTDDSLMETVSHGTQDYPFCCYIDDMDRYDFRCIDWHWHSELEFAYVESGTVSFDAGAAHGVLEPGMGLMVNARVLHGMQAPEGGILPNFLFHPTLVAPEGSRIYENYVRPLVTSSLEYLVFRQEVPWQAQCLTWMREIIALSKDTGGELPVAIRVQQLWSLILENVPLRWPENPPATLSRTRLQQMVQYIQSHYPENITLADIAAAAGVSKSTALHLFRETLKTSPMEFAIRYRLRQAARLLANTEEKITAISQETGFNSVDHFCRSFKKAYRQTPTAYRTQSPMNGTRPS